MQGESEGKDGKGVFPVTGNCETDLHSFGQYIQDCRRNLFETLFRVDGGVPNMVVELDKQNAFTLGQAIYFFEVSVAIAGYLNGGHPFDQPGLEAYKRNMFGLLGKPGYEEITNKLKMRL